MLKLISKCLFPGESNNAADSVVIKVLEVQLYIPANSWMIENQNYHQFFIIKPYNYVFRFTGKR